MKTFKQFLKHKISKVKKIENIILFVGAILIALRLFFPVLQCRANVVDQIECPKGAVSFFSFRPDVKYSFHTERTHTQAVALAVLTVAFYFIARKNRGMFN